MMTKKVIRLMGVLAIAVAISGCAITKQDAGTVIGGGLGGFLGSQFGSGSGKKIAIGAGAVLGAFLGNKVGASLDQADQMAMNQTLNNVPAGESVQWQNPNGGHTVQVTPTTPPQESRVRTNRGTVNTVCREYQTTITVEGRQQQGYGTACRRSDGSWQLINR